MAWQLAAAAAAVIPSLALSEGGDTVSKLCVRI